MLKNKTLFCICTCPTVYVNTHLSCLTKGRNYFGTRNSRFGMQGKKNSYSSVVVMEISEMKYMFILVQPVNTQYDFKLMPSQKVTFSYACKGMIIIIMKFCLLSEQKEKNMMAFKNQCLNIPECIYTGMMTDTQVCMDDHNHHIKCN